MVTLTHPSAAPEILPDELWDHELFRDSATFREPSTPLLTEQLDIRLRKLRLLPSSSDETPAMLLHGMHQLYQHARKWITELRGQPSSETNLLGRLDRIQNMLTAPISDELLQRSLVGVIPLLPNELRSFAPPIHSTRQETADRLTLIAMLLVERMIGRDPSCRRRYLKQVYKTLDQSLATNSTTDTVRLRPVLQWIRERLIQQRQAGCAYVDVGCAIAAGAPGVVEAAMMLRDHGPCSAIHGVDIVGPSRKLALERARQGILLYAGEPLRRPLPRKYDVILLANVHRHLTVELQARLFRHLGESLREYGMLFVNWRFSATHSPCVSLERRRGRLWLEAERNCV